LSINYYLYLLRTGNNSSQRGLWNDSDKMLKFLRKIFQNEEQEVKKVTEIGLQNIEEWINESSKPLMEDLNQRTEEILMKIDEETQRAKFNIEVLENAKLQNPNIPFKAKQYMEGNRKAYLKAISSFLGHLEINNKSYHYLANFCKEFDELINDLNKGTLRSYTILQEFFANETNNIAQNLKSLNEIFKEMKSVLNNENITAVNELTKKAQSLKAKSNQKINIEVEIKKVSAELKLANGNRDSIITDVEKFNESDEYKHFVNLNEEKKSKANTFYNDESRILQSFSVLEKPLRKYSHIAFEHEEIVINYLKQPIETLINDKNMEILQILKNLQNFLKDNKLQIDYKKKEKSLEEINKLNKDFIEQFLREYSSFKNEIENLDSKIKESGVSEKLKNFNGQLEDINLDIKRYEQEFARLESELIKLQSHITSLAGEIKSSIKTVFNDEIEMVGIDNCKNHNCH